MAIDYAVLLECEVRCLLGSGDVAQVGEKRYEYDSAGRPTNLYVNDQLKAQYQYNAWGERICKTLITTTEERMTQRTRTYNLYEDHQLAAEITAQGAIARQYIYQDAAPTVILQGQEAYYIHTEIGRAHV